MELPVFIVGCYAYKNDEQGNLIIVEEEAEIVHYVFSAYLEEKACTQFPMN